MYMYIYIYIYIYHCPQALHGVRTSGSAAANRHLAVECVQSAIQNNHSALYGIIVYHIAVMG